ncbi:hypothetical protein V1477_002840 [Vespula maculifrons]
MQPFAR